MASVNMVMILGNLGQDPELRSTQGGKQVCNLRIATSDSWKDASGQRQERTEWHSVACWGATADACGKYLTKGSKVFVEGKLQTRKWTDKSGQDRYQTEILASNVVFCERGPGGQSAQRPMAAADDGDLPF